MVAIIALVACAGGDRTDASPTAPVPPPPDTIGTVQRGVLTVAVRVEAADTTIATAIGIAPGAPAGVTVTLTPLADGTRAPAIAVTDAAGRATFRRLLEGPYSLAVERPLTAAERATLPTEDQDVSGFAGGTTLTIAPGNQQAEVRAVAGRPGSLVISEIWPYAAPIGSEWLAYSYSAFVEFYNNGDTTVFMDGMIFGAITRASANPRSADRVTDYCGTFRDVRADPSALPLSATQVFPGTGRDYPVAPGEAIILAIDAIDHRPFGEGTLDLSGADFESYGDTRDIDNPAVPNVTGLPGTLFRDHEGRGFPFGWILPDAYVLAKPAVRPLTRRTIDSTFGPLATDVPFLAAEDVLDMAWLDRTPEVLARLAANGAFYDRCAVPWHPRWERAPAPLIDLDSYRGNRRTLARRVAYVRPDGRAVLQRTKTSARDWTYQPGPSPGSVR